MDTIFAFTQRAAYPLLWISMGVILLWIGAIKFPYPTPVVELLQASLPIFASDAFVYVLGAVEVILALALFAGYQVKYVGIILTGLFAVTLFIFLIAPMMAHADRGFPILSPAGEFLLKDLVLLATSVTLVAMASANEAVTKVTEVRRARAA